MKKYTIIALLGVSLFMAGCGRPEATTQETAVEDTRAQFYIETVSLNDISNGSEIKKTGRVLGSQDIVVSSQASGRVSGISGNIGDSISKGKRIITLSDSTGIYTFSAQRANASVKQARLNYEQTMLSLDKAISDTDLAIQQAENQAKNSALGAGNSSAELQLKQLESSLEKATLDLQTKISSDEQTIRNFGQTTNTLVTSVQLLYEDVITTTDKLLGVSTLRQSENDAFERTLGVRNSGTRFLAEGKLRSAIQKQIEVDGYVPDISTNGLSLTLGKIKAYTTDLQPLLDSVDTMLNFTDESGSFSQGQLDATIAQINGLQAQVQGQVSSITQQINSIQSFLNTYKQQQESIKESIEGIKRQIGSTKEQLKTVSLNANIGLESAQNAYNNTIKNKGTTQQSLLNAITQAQIASNEAQTNLGKLTIEAPIEGSIGDILVDIGQEVNPGTPLFTISSTQQQEIEIALTSDEVERVTQGQSVKVESDGKIYDGSLISIATASNATLGFKAIVRLDETIALVGGAASISIPLESDTVLIPLKFIKILNKDQAQLTTWNGKTIEEKIIKIGKVRGSSIEIIDELGENVSIVTNDVSNYDPNKFILTPKS